MRRYTFGDDEAAAERLRLVADAYEPVSRGFISDHRGAATGMAIDIGCGPGFSTRLVAEVCHPRQLVGIDPSEAFLERARRSLPTASFVALDATDVPLPGVPADLIYARLVLAHLPEPAHVAELWLSQLAAGGTLLIEDLECVEAPRGPLSRYEDHSARMVRQGGGLLYAGEALRTLGGRLERVTVPAEVAARIYLFNVRRWITGSPDGALTDELTALAEELDRLGAATASTTAARVTWVVRQVVLRP